MTNNDDESVVRKSIRITKQMDESIKHVVGTSEHILNESDVIRRALAIGLTKIKEDIKHGKF